MLTPILTLVFVSFIVYFNALSGDFVYDDTLQILENQWITDFRNIPTMFSKDVWNFHAWNAITNYYRPLMHVVYTLNYYLFGLTPWGFHLVNVLIHCGATVLVFLLARRLLPEHRKSVTPIYLSPPFIAAILFASHPIHTEAVTWIAGLPDVAFTFFYLLAFYLYVRSSPMLSVSYLLSVVCFAVATLFKEPSLTLPVILAAYDYGFRESRSRFPDYVKRYLPYFLVGAGYLALRVNALGGFVPHKRYGTLNVYEYAINVFPLFTQYLEKLIVPLNLNAFYVFHPIHSLFDLKGILSLMATLVFVSLTLIALKKNKVSFFGLLFVTVPLLPVLYIPAMGENTFAERYLYLPSVGYVILLAIFLSWTMEKLKRALRSVMIVFIVITVLYAVGTITRNDVWQNGLSLWTDTVNKSPDSSMVHNSLGIAYASRGLNDRAIPEYQTAVRLDPEFVQAHNNLGVAYASQGLTDRAIFEYKAALWLDPDFAEVHYNLGFEYAAQGLFDKAVAEYQTALRLRPDYVEAHNNLGLAYTSQGLIDKAVTEFQTALQLRPDFNEARQHLNDIASGRN